jgi:hypothetical protein
MDVVQTRPQSFPRIMSKCKHEGVRLGAFFITCMHYAFAKSVRKLSGMVPLSTDGEHMMLNVNTDFNMRQRIEPPISNENVSCFIGIGDILRTGVPISVPLWELVRQVQRELEAATDAGNQENIYLGILRSQLNPETFQEIENVVDLRK